MEDFFGDPRPVKAINWQLPTDKMGYGYEYSGDRTTVRGKRWMDTFVNMLLEGPTKFLNRRKTMELNFSPNTPEYMAQEAFEHLAYGPQKMLNPYGKLIETLGTAHADFLLGDDKNIFAGDLIKSMRSKGYTAGAMTMQSAGVDHIDSMNTKLGAAEFNHILKPYGNPETDWLSVWEDMDGSGIKKWNLPDSVRFGNVYDDVCPVEAVAEGYGRFNSLYGIAATGAPDNIAGINANFADYSGFFSKSRTVVEQGLLQAKQTGNYKNALSFWELALTKQNNPGGTYWTEEGGWHEVALPGDTGEENDPIHTTADDYDNLFTTNTSKFQLAVTMLESRRRYWQALTLLMSSFRGFEAALNKAALEAAAQSADLGAKVAGFQTYESLVGQNAKKAEAGIDEKMIDWWEDFQNNQTVKEGGLYNQKFTQLFFEIQHHMANVIEPFFNSMASPMQANKYRGPGDPAGGVNVNHYFVYPFTAGAGDAIDRVSNEIENKGIFEYNRWMIQGLNAYQTEYETYTTGAYNGVKNLLIDIIDHPGNYNAQQRADAIVTITNGLNTMESDPNFIKTMNFKVLKEKLDHNQVDVTALRNEVEYLVGHGGGLREFRSEFQLGKPAWGINPYDGFSDDQKARFGITASMAGMVRQPISGDRFNFDMTQGLVVNIENSDSDNYHSSHVYNSFQRLPLSGGIKTQRKSDIIMKGMIALDIVPDENNSDDQIYGVDSLITQSNPGFANANYTKYFGGQTRNLYNTIGHYRMRADIMDYDQKWKQYCDFINNQNRSNKTSYNTRYEDWKTRKENWEFDQYIAEKQRQKAIADNNQALYLISKAGQKQQNENKRREMVAQKTTKKKELRQENFTRLYSQAKEKIRNKKQEEKQKVTAKKMGKGQQKMTMAMIKKQFMKSSAKKAKG